MPIVVPTLAAPERRASPGQSPRAEVPFVVRGFAGVNQLEDASLIADNELQVAQNWVPRDAIGLPAKMRGSSRINSSLITVGGVAVNRVVQGIRYYRHNATNRYTILVCHMASGADEVIQLDGNTVTQITGGSALPTAGEYNLAVYNDVPYLFSNGTVVQQINNTASTKANGAAWMGTYYPGIVYKDRIAMVSSSTAKNDLLFSNTGDPAIQNASSPLRITLNDGDWITALGLLSINTSDQGLENQLLIGRNGSIWVYQGDLGAGRLEQASGKIGIRAWRSIAQTPVGTVFVGIENRRLNVYLMREAGEPLAVGGKIQQDLSDVPTGQWNRISGVYHDGFYKCCIPAAGGTTNTREWWLDLRAWPQIHWWGPHTGLAIACYVPWEGANDDGRLTCGDDTAGTLWQREATASFQIGTTTITSVLQTKEVDYGLPFHPKLWNRGAIAHAAASTDTATIRMIVDAITTISRNITLQAAGMVWGTGLWGLSLIHI